MCTVQHLRLAGERFREQLVHEGQRLLDDADRVSVAVDGPALAAPRGFAAAACLEEGE